MAKARGRGKAKKSKSVKARKKTKVVRKVARKVSKVKKTVNKGFQAIWGEIGDRLWKEIKAEKGWDRKRFTAKIEDSDTQIQILASTKRLFPGVPEPALVPEIRAAEAAIGQIKLPAFNTDSDFWQSSSRDGDDAAGDPHS